MDYYVEAGRGLSPEVELRSIIFQAGSIKGEVFQTGMAVPEGGVQCLQRGEDGTILHQLVFENPLIKRVEFVNEQGDFEQKTIRLDSTHLLIRTMLHLVQEELRVVWQAPEGDCALRIVDAQGRLLQIIPVDEQQVRSIGVSSWRAGTYWVQFVRNGQILHSQSWVKVE
ncbi:MAG: hypothetical protein AAGH79_16965 [Bacteroidota bacterium]